MALSDRNQGPTSVPTKMAPGDSMTASQMNKIINSVLRLVIGDGKTIGVSYVGGKAVIHSLARQLIPVGRGSGDGGVVVSATKAGLSSPGATSYFTRGWVTGELGTNYGPWIWDGTAWALVPVTYTTLSNSARAGDLALVSGKGYVKIAAGSGTDKWSCPTHIGPT